MPTLTEPEFLKRIYFDYTEPEQGSVFFPTTTFNNQLGEDVITTKLHRHFSTYADNPNSFYDNMLTNELVFSALIDSLMRSVISSPRWVEPGDGHPKSIEYAHFTVNFLSKISKFNEFLRHYLTRVTHGRSHTEIIYENPKVGNLANSWIPTSYIDTPMGIYGYNNRKLFIRKANLKRIFPKPGKILTSFHETNWMLSGKPLLDELHFYYHLKKHGLTYYSNMIKNWVVPILMGIYPQGETDKKKNQQYSDILMKAMTDIEHGYAFTLPEDLKVAPLNADRSNTFTFDNYIQYIDRAAAVKIWAETRLTGTERSTGSYAAAKVGAKVPRKEATRYLANSLMTELNDIFIKFVIDLNFNVTSLGGRYPKLIIDTSSLDEVAIKRTGMAFILESGHPVGLNDLYRTYSTRIPFQGEQIFQIDRVFGETQSKEKSLAEQD